jgi:CheY-like chemotaxis protein
MKILIVDDTLSNILIFRKILEKRGFTVFEARSAMDAFELIETQAIDLIFMDIDMPIMDGLKATMHIREKLQLKMPVIAYSAMDRLFFEERCMAAGMNDFLQKPVKLDELYSLLNKYSIAPNQ